MARRVSTPSEAKRHRSEDESGLKRDLSNSCSALMGDWRCKPVLERGIYGVYIKADIAALKERNRKLRAQWTEVCHRNAELECENDKLRQMWRESEGDIEWMNLS